MNDIQLKDQDIAELFLRMPEAKREAIIIAQERMIKEGNMPTIDHLYKFLDDCADMFENEHMRVMKRIGLDKIVRKDLLYKNNMHREV